MTDLASNPHIRLLELSQQYLTEIDDVLAPVSSPEVGVKEQGETLPPDLEAGWRRRANCLGSDPDLFFPERGADYRQAKAICRACEVREECLNDALDRREYFGIWGGLSERERRKIRRRRSLLGRLGIK